MNERQHSGTVEMQGEEVAKVNECKHMDSTVQDN